MVFGSWKFLIIKKDHCVHDVSDRPVDAKSVICSVSADVSLKHVGGFKCEKDEYLSVWKKLAASEDFR